MKTHIALALHAYQPPTQPQNVIDDVYHESYEPVIALAEENPYARFSMDITKSLGERLPKQFLTRIGKLCETQKIELINTAAYHYILPLTPPWIVARQMILNSNFYRSRLGISRTSGIFLPELAYSPELVSMFANLGYSWCIADDGPYEFSRNRVLPPYRVPQNWIIIQQNLGVFLRSRFWSNTISREHMLNGQLFLQKLIEGQETWRNEKGLNADTYIVLAVDFETIGHHRKNGIDFFLKPFFKEAARMSHRCSLVPIEFIFKNYWKQQQTEQIPPGSWSTSKEDFKNGVYYSLWHHPKNPYHRAWNEFMQLTFAAAPKNPAPELQKLLDTAFYSCSPWQYSNENKDIAAWCFPLFEEIISLLDGHDAVPQLRYRLEEMKRIVS